MKDIESKVKIIGARKNWKAYSTRGRPPVPQEDIDTMRKLYKKYGSAEIVSDIMLYSKPTILKYVHLDDSINVNKRGRPKKIKE